MAEARKKTGYCSMCMQNVEHSRVFSSFFTQCCDFLTLGLLGRFRIGPYYCFQCEGKKWFLPAVRMDVPTFDSTRMASQFNYHRSRGLRGEIVLEDETLDPLEVLPPGNSATEKNHLEILPHSPLDSLNRDSGPVNDNTTKTFEPIGNRLRNSQSLVMQERRSRKYSVNFRDSTVVRILSGEKLLGDIRKELNLNETDLVRWIADLIHRRQQRIDELENLLETVKQDVNSKLARKIDHCLNKTDPNTIDTTK